MIAEIFLVENFSHLLTFLFILIPIYLMVRILLKERGEELINSMWWIVAGLLPLAIYHLFEFLLVFNINFLPAEETQIHLILDHALVIVAFISVSWFIYLFKKRYVDPAYSGKK